MTNLIIEDCFLDGIHGFYIPLNSSANLLTGLVIRRTYLSRIYMRNTVDRDCTDALIENCIIQPLTTIDPGELAYVEGYYNVTFNNCTWASPSYLSSGMASVRVEMVSATNKVYIYNCAFEYMLLRCEFGSDDAIVEDYNTHPESQLSPGTYDRVTPGANTGKHIQLFVLPLIFPNGSIFPYDEFTYSSESHVPTLACDSNSASDDIFGVTRPATISKRTRGAIQYNILEREATTVYGTSPESFMMRDAMGVQFIVPITGSNLKFSCRVYRETDYAGTLPQVTIKQYGEADIVLTDVGSSQAWNRFSHNFSPANFPLFIAVEIRSNNTATSGDYKVFWDALEVK